MFRLGHSPVSRGSELDQPLTGGSLILQPRKGPESRVKVSLGLLRNRHSLTGISLRRGPAFKVREGFTGRLDHHLLRNPSRDNHAPGTVLRGRAAVEGIAAALLGLGADDHPRSADSTPQDSKPGKQALRLRSTPTGHADPLDGLPKRAFNYGGVGIEVDQPAEVNLPEVEARGEHGLNASVSTDDSTVSEEGPDLGNRLPPCPQLESLGHHGSIGVGDQDPILSSVVAGGDAGEGDDASGNGSGLGFSASLPGRAAVILAHGSEDRPLEPLGSGSAADVPHIDGDNPPPCFLDPRDDLLLDLERADKAVEVGDDDDLGPAGLYSLNRVQEPGTFGKRGAPGNVQLLMDGDEPKPVPLTRSLNPLSLLGGGDEGRTLPALGLGDSDDADGPDAGDATIFALRGVRLGRNRKYRGAA